MKRTQLKDALRTIRARAVSWIAVTIVAMMGCAIYLGAHGYADSLDAVASDFLDATNYLDLKVSAVPGLSDEDLDALRAVDGVVDVEGTYTLDAATLGVGGQDLDVQVVALTERISLPEYAEGTAPVRANEVALSVDLMDDYGIAIGDRVVLDAGPGVPEGFLKRRKFSVTGSVRHGACLLLGGSYGAFVAPIAFETALVRDLYSTAYLDVSTAETCESSASALADELHVCRHAVEDVLSERAETRAHESIVLPDGTQIAEPELGYVVVSREQQGGCLSLRSNTQVLRSVSNLFAAIFMVVSVIVTVSTITILVNDEMRLLGAMKALGFTDADIVRKYLVFSMLSISLGMVLAVPGAFVLEYFMDGVLGTMYCCGHASLQVEFGQLALMAALGLAITAVATCVVALRIVRSRPAVQLLAGDRAMTKVRREKSTARHTGTSLYARLITRNLATDLVRVVVSIAIVLGSCLTIGMGLTMRTSFHGLIGRSAEEVTHYDLRVDLGKADGADELDRLVEWLEDEGATCVTLMSTTAAYRVGDTTDALTILVADDDTFRDFYELRSYGTGKALAPQEDGILVANRTSEISAVNEGETMVLYDAGLQPHELTVDGVARIFVGRLAFMSREGYERVYGAAPQDNVVLARLARGTNRDELVERLEEAFPRCEMDYPDVLPRLIAEGFETVFDLLVALMLVLALVLSVFVLLNLANIFVHRRRYELAVMAINGFSHRQLVGYLLRETLVTIGLGLASGVVVGCLANEAFIRAAEVGDVMFVRELDPRVWLLAALIEAVLALAVYLVAFRQLRDLDIADANGIGA